MRYILRRVQPDGTVKQRADEMITSQITVTAEQEALIHRLTETLSARGHVPTTAEAIITAVDKINTSIASLADGLDSRPYVKTAS